MASHDSDCSFCSIVQGETDADVVYRDEVIVAFLDRRPLFPGHVLVVPTEHVETLGELRDDAIPPLMRVVRALSRAMESGLGAEGSFVAVNNKVSQSVPHLHVHVVPRTKGDGLRGFFWPRRGYQDDDERLAVVARLRDALALEIRADDGATSPAGRAASD